MPYLSHIGMRLGLLIFMSLAFLNCSDIADVSETSEPICLTDLRCTPSTKTSMSGETASFVSSDRIGVFETLTGRNNVLYTNNSSVWSTSTPMYWLNYTSTHQFYAYYPYNSSNNGLSIPIPALASQTISSIPDSKSDLLVTSKAQTRTPSVNFTFTHGFTLLKFNVTILSSILSTLLPGNIILSGGNSTGSGNWGMFNLSNNISNISYNLSTKQLSYSANNNTTFQQSISAKMPTLISGSTTIYVLALPGTYTNPAPSVQFSMNIILSGLAVYSSQVSLSLPTLQPNTRYEYNVSITSKLLTKSKDIPDSLDIQVTPVES